MDTSAPRHVFLSLRAPFAAIRFFYETVLPQITEKFVLVSGSEDVTVPHQTDQRWRPFDDQERAMVASLLDDPRLIRWFAENLDTRHPRMSAMPLGMVWPEGPPAHIASLALTPSLAPRPLTVFCAHRIRDEAQWDLRRKVSLLASQNWAAFTTHAATEMSEDNFVAEVKRHSFVLCADGGGIDPSPKAWLALLCGSIPIIRDTPVADAYRALPVAVVRDWCSEEITLQRLAAWKAELLPCFDSEVHRARVLDRLSLDFWWRQISDT